MNRRLIWRSRTGWRGCRRPRSLSTCHCQSVSVMNIFPNDFPYQKTLGVTPKTSLYHVQNQSYNFTPWNCSWPPTAPPSCYWLFSSSKGHGSDPKWFPMQKNLGFDTTNKSLACLEPKLEIYHIFKFCQIFKSFIVDLTCCQGLS